MPHLLAGLVQWVLSNWRIAQPQQAWLGIDQLQNSVAVAAADRVFNSRRHLTASAQASQVNMVQHHIGKRLHVCFSRHVPTAWAQMPMHPHGWKNDRAHVLLHTPLLFQLAQQWRQSFGVKHGLDLGEAQLSRGAACLLGQVPQPLRTLSHPGLRPQRAAWRNLQVPLSSHALDNKNTDKQSWWTARREASHMKKQTDAIIVKMQDVPSTWESDCRPARAAAPCHAFRRSLLKVAGNQILHLCEAKHGSAEEPLNIAAQNPKAIASKGMTICTVLAYSGLLAPPFPRQQPL